MFPTFELFNKNISTYIIAGLIGCITAGFFACKKAKKHNLDDYEMLMILLISSIGSFLGSHLLYAAVNYKLITIFINNISKIKSFNMFYQCMKEIFGGSVFYGGLIGGLIVGYIYTKKKKLNFGSYSDIVAPSIPLFHCFGRIGCFLGGCCYGIECDVGFTYTRAIIDEANGVRRFPVQLVESFLNLLVFLLLNYFLKNKKYKNILIYIYLLLYSIVRFTLEFLRGDSYRGIFYGLSTSQYISLLIIVFSLYKLKSMKNIKAIKDGL